MWRQALEIHTELFWTLHQGHQIKCAKVMELLYYIPAERVAYVVGIANVIVSAILLFGAIASLNHIQATHGDTPGSRGALHDNICCFQFSFHKREARKDFL